jgi:hypothetical protein
MRTTLMSLLLVAVALNAGAQSMTSITPNYGPGGSSGGSMTIVGTGFSTAPKSTRFVDINNVDIFNSVSCSSTTTCTGYARPGMVATGSIQTFAVFALVNGVKSASTSSFIYYGPPTFTSLSPSSSATRSGVSGITITGTGFTSNANGFPGTTSIYLYSNINDRTTGCASTTSCTNYTAPALDCCAPNGPLPVVLSTPGGTVQRNFIYVSAAPTPTITSVTPNKGSGSGGTVVTIQGTNFSTTANKTIFTLYSVGSSNQLSSVSCSSTTQCTGTTPAGNGKGRLEALVSTTSPSQGTSSAPSADSAGDDFTYTGLNFSTQNVTVAENGQQATFTVALNSQPTSSVTVNFTIQGFVTEGAVSPTQVVFTTGDWNIPKTLTVIPNDDLNADGNRGFTVAGATTSSDANYNNLNGGVSATNLDNEAKGYMIAQPSGLVTNESGGSATYKMVLLKAPSSTVTVALTSGDIGEGTVSPSSLTFATSSGGGTGWDVPRTITVTGVDDAFADGDVSYQIIHNATTADAAYNNTVLQDMYLTNADNEGLAAAGPRGDFNGDNKPDIVLRNYSTGQDALWLMNGTAFSSIVDLPALPAAAYHIEGTADFNADGKTDIVLRNHSTGQNALWIMNGTSLSTIVDLPALANTDYHIEGTGDFNGDTKPDIILRNYVTGQDALWIMNGTSLSTILDLPALPNTSYRFESCGDFNADGKLDLLLRNYSTGQNALWLMNGTSLSTIVDLPALANVSYRFDGVSDFNADGKPDILLRNYATGQNAIWVMNGTSVQTVVDLPTLANLSYEFNGPR